jgi:hypothetical protein
LFAGYAWHSPEEMLTIPAAAFEKTLLAGQGAKKTPRRATGREFADYKR